MLRWLGTLIVIIWGVNDVNVTGSLRFLKEYTIILGERFMRQLLEDSEFLLLFYQLWLYGWISRDGSGKKNYWRNNSKLVIKQELPPTYHFQGQPGKKKFENFYHFHSNRIKIGRFRYIYLQWIQWIVDFYGKFMLVNIPITWILWDWILVGLIGILIIL